MAFSILSRIFGSDDVIKKAADGVYNGVDAVFFTKEEQAGHFVNLLKAYEPYKLAQRLLAMLVGIPFVGIWLLCAMLFLASATMTIYDDDCIENKECKPQQMMVVADALSVKNNATLGEPFVWICIFYFGGGALEGTARAVANRKKKAVEKVE